MKIGFDMISAGRGFGPAAGGMVVYYRDLLAALCRLPTVDCVETYVAPRNQSLAIPNHWKVRHRACKGIPRNRVGRIIYEQSVFPLYVSRQKSDVLLSTHNTRPLAWRGPSVVVLQSLQYMVFPEAYGFLRRRFLEWIVPQSLRTADAVIAVSEWERQQVLAHFDVDPTRIFVVHHGTSSVASDRDKVPVVVRRALGGNPYILAVSTLYAFKNHRRLLKAFALVTKRCTIPHRLVIAGGDGDVTARELGRYAQELGIDERVLFTGPISNDKVPSLMLGASAVVYPSLFETFGHPVLEALALGCCLITSECTATREIAGDAARLVDPYDTESIAAGIEAVLVDPELRNRLEAAGPSQAAKFTWDRCAKDTLAVLQLAVDRWAG